LANLDDESSNEVIAKLVWGLRQICSSSVDEVRLRAARCLGLLGPIGFKALTATPPPLQLHQTSANLPEASLSLAPIRTKLLEKLDSYLSSPSVRLMKISVQILENIFATDPGQLALSELKHEKIQARLSQFSIKSGTLEFASTMSIASSSSAAAAANNASVGSASGISRDNYWTPPSSNSIQKFNSWLCTFTSQLAKYEKNYILFSFIFL